jgi:anti-sigma factor RsiW
MCWYQIGMSDIASTLSAEEIAELSALADGTLPAERRPAVEARVAASPELRALVERQRRAVAATSAAASEPVPTSLQAAVEERVRGARGRRGRAGRLVPRLAFGGAAAAVATVVLVLLLVGGSSGPTVADAARIALRPSTEPAPPPLDHSRAKLSERVDGVVFPDLGQSWGWRAVGLRHDSLDGRNTAIVTYASHGRRIWYGVVAGSALPRPSEAQTTVRRGVSYETLRVDGQATVTWQRLGHTCVLIGAASPRKLLTLASWRGRGTLRY